MLGVLDAEAPAEGAPGPTMCWLLRPVPSTLLGQPTCGTFYRGELVWITERGISSYQWADQTQRKLCVFEMIYFSRPDSIVNGESLYSYRRRLGHQLAKEGPR